MAQSDGVEQPWKATATAHRDAAATGMQRTGGVDRQISLGVTWTGARTVHRHRDDRKRIGWLNPRQEKRDPRRQKEDPDFSTNFADRSAGKCSSGQATLAAQRGSVSRKLIFWLCSS